MFPLSGSLSGTWVTLTFPMLSDGSYRLTVHDTLANINGTKLDGKGDGVAGSDWTADFTVVFSGGLTPDHLGIFSGGYWYRDLDGNRQIDSGDGAPEAFGWNGAIPVVGDWNGAPSGSGKTEIGVYSQGYWWLDTNGDGVLDSGDEVFAFGFAGPNVVPVVGDWNGDGKTEVGVYCNGAWFRDIDGSHTWDTANQAGVAYLGWAASTQTVIPVPGDWNGEGKTEIGVYCNGVWFRDTAGTGQWDGSYTYWGWNGALVPVAGDWNGEGKDEPGVYSQGVWFRDYDNTDQWDVTNQSATAYYGWPGALPVVGNWGSSLSTDSVQAIQTAVTSSPGSQPAQPAEPALAVAIGRWGTFGGQECPFVAPGGTANAGQSGLVSDGDSLGDVDTLLDLATKRQHITPAWGIAAS